MRSGTVARWPPSTRTFRFVRRPSARGRRLAQDYDDLVPLARLREGFVFGGGARELWLVSTRHPSRAGPARARRADAHDVVQGPVRRHVRRSRRAVHLRVPRRPDRPGRTTARCAPPTSCRRRWSTSARWLPASTSSSHRCSSPPTTQGHARSCSSLGCLSRTCSRAASCRGRKCARTRRARRALRLHQQRFKLEVMRAYRHRCAICALRERSLVQAAHIVPDVEPEGIAAVVNGLALCAIHHLAFDRNVLGIDPDGVVHIAASPARRDRRADVANRPAGLPRRGDRAAAAAATTGPIRRGWSCVSSASNARRHDGLELAAYIETERWPQRAAIAPGDVYRAFRIPRQLKALDASGGQDSSPLGHEVTQLGIVVPMDVARPYAAVTGGGLEGEVLTVLAGTTRPLTGRQVARLARNGSDRGLRLALNRLAEQGLVDTQDAPPAVLYTLNHDHIAAPVALALVGLRSALCDRLRDAIAQWEIPPVHVSLFGSAARGDGDATSDIDLFVVRPQPLAVEDQIWRAQLDSLANDVVRWTGNHAGISDVGEDRAGRPCWRSSARGGGARARRRDARRRRRTAPAQNGGSAGVSRSARRDADERPIQSG